MSCRVEIIACEKECIYGNPCRVVYYVCGGYWEQIMTVVRKGDLILWAFPEEIAENDCLEDVYIFDGTETPPSKDDILLALTEAVYHLRREVMESDW